MPWVAVAVMWLMLLLVLASHHRGWHRVEGLHTEFDE